MKQFNSLTILSIETSCDDTCIAIIKASGKKRPRFDILSNIVSSQIEIHKKWGGVYPTIAKREHQRNLAAILEKALKEAKLLKISKSEFLWTRSELPVGLLSKQILNPKFQTLNAILEKEPDLLRQSLSFFKKYQVPKVDLIAVTVGPGLEPCLWVGINFAKALSYYWNLPIVPVNHIEAHIFANWLSPVSFGHRMSNIFPAVCLVVSGGHTQLILMKDFGDYKILGETRDDAAGECFDKTARILGLEYPGGPVIAAEAAKFPIFNFQFSIKLPRPMMNQKNYGFSFSGLKTAVLYDFKKRPEKIRKSKEYIQGMAKEIQQAIIDVLIHKTVKAAKELKAKTIILGGGVTANKELRKQFKERLITNNRKFNFLVPPKKFCTDNAAMVGVAGYFGWLRSKTKPWQKVKVEANLRIGSKNSQLPISLDRTK